MTQTKLQKVAWANVSSCSIDFLLKILDFPKTANFSKTANFLVPVETSPSALARIPFVGKQRTRTASKGRASDV